MRTCLDCPADISDRSHKALRCAECSLRAKRCSARAWKFSHKQPPVLCGDCQQSIPGSRKDTQRCGACNVLHKRCVATAWQKANLDASRTRSKSWKLANLARFRARQEEWRKRNPEAGRQRSRLRQASLRSATAGGIISAEQWAHICEQYQYRCAYCFVNSKLTMDHFVPLSHGGKNDALNVVPACLFCNSSKGAKTFLLWFSQGHGSGLGTTNVTVY